MRTDRRDNRKLLARPSVSNSVISTRLLQHSGPGRKGDGMSSIIGFDSFPSTPKNEDLDSQICSQIHGLHRFLESVSAYLGVVRGKGSIAEDRIV